MVDVSLIPPAITAGAALIGASLGSGLTAYFAGKRLRFDEKAAERQAQRQRREDARPKVGELADAFLRLEDLAAVPLSPADRGFEHRFADAWEEIERRLRRLILEVPDAVARQRLTGLVFAVNVSFSEVYLTKFHGQREYVAAVAELGGEVTGALLRDDVVEPAVLERLTTFDRLVADWDERMQNQEEARQEERETRGS